MRSFHRIALALCAACIVGGAAGARAQQQMGQQGQQQGQEKERPCMADAARLCPNIEPGGGKQIACLKAHKEQLSPKCKEKVLQMKVNEEERGPRNEA